MEDNKKLNVFQKIIELKKEVKCFRKDSESNSFKYVSGSQVLAKITNKMNELGLLFLPKESTSTGWQTHNYKNSYGKEKIDFVVFGKLTYAWINADDPTDIWEIPFDYYGQQADISQAYGSALTYSERYLLLKSLGLNTDEADPDRYKNEDDEKPFNKPTQEHLDEAIRLGIKLDKIAPYYKLNSFDEVTDEMIVDVIERKKASKEC